MDFDEKGIKESTILNKTATPAGAPQGGSPTPRGSRGSRSKYVTGILLVVLAGAIAAFVFLLLKLNSTSDTLQSMTTERDQAKLAAEQAQLDLQQTLMERDFQDLDEQFAAIENRQIVIRDDSVKRDLMDKYENAKLRLEELKQQLNDQRQKSAAEIQRLNGEISTLRDLLRQYLQQIDELTKENQALREENQGLRDENSNLSSQVQQTRDENERLNERMTLAEKLNVTGVTLTALNNKGKKEKKVEKAKQLMVTFTIPQNNSTPVGEKTIYLRITSPSGQLLGNAGTFSFEGTSLACSAKKVVDYAGQEIGGVTIYWDVNTALSAGDYTVELFADNFRLVSKHFDMK